MTAARHLELLLEEQSMEEFLQVLLPKVLPESCTFNFYVSQGKQDLLKNLNARLRDYSRWLPDDWRIVVVVDRDNDDCGVLKDKLEKKVADAGLRTRSQCQDGAWQLVIRIAVEELEAWYFGDWEAVRQAYPRVLCSVPKKRRYRKPDDIRGGTGKAFEQILQKGEYFRTGLLKTEAAKTIAPYIAPERNNSRSFRMFYNALVEATA